MREIAIRLVAEADGSMGVSGGNGGSAWQHRAPAEPVRGVRSAVAALRDGFETAHSPLADPVALAELGRALRDTFLPPLYASFALPQVYAAEAVEALVDEQLARDPPRRPGVRYELLGDNIRGLREGFYRVVAVQTRRPETHVFCLRLVTELAAACQRLGREADADFAAFVRELALRLTGAGRAILTCRYVPEGWNAVQGSFGTRPYRILSRRTFSSTSAATTAWLGGWSGAS